MIVITIVVVVVFVVVDIVEILTIRHHRHENVPQNNPETPCGEAEGAVCVFAEEGEGREARRGRRKPVATDPSAVYCFHFHSVVCPHGSPVSDCKQTQLCHTCPARRAPSA